MKILSHNLIDDYAAADFSSEVSNLWAANVRIHHLIVPWRTQVPDAQYYILDAGVGLGITADCAAIAGHNLSNAAGVRIQAHPTNAWAAPDLDEVIRWANLVADPEDLTTANWTNSNSTDALSDSFIDGKRFTQITATAAFGYVRQNVTFSADGVKSAQGIIKKGSDQYGRIVLYDFTAAAVRLQITVDFTAQTVTADTGTLDDCTWIDTDIVRVSGHSTAVVAVNVNAILARVITNGLTANYTAIRVEDAAAPSAYNIPTGPMMAFFASTSKRFWRFYLDDPANPDGYLQIGRLGLGVALQMPPIEPGAELPVMSTAQRSIAPGGQVFGQRGVRLLAPAFSLPIVSQAERLAILEMFDEVENIRPVFLAVWEDSLTVQGPIYCVVDQDRLEFKKAAEAGVMFTLELAFRQVT